MKNLLVLLIVAAAFISCEKDDVDEAQEPVVAAKVVGEWQMYRDENLESVIDEWTGTEWTTVDKWYANDREDSVIILEFNADGTFVKRYADVVTANGVWTKTEDDRYSLNYIQDENPNEALTQTRFITFHCDNTYSIKIEGNDSRILYYKIIGTTECSELINYNVE